MNISKKEFTHEYIFRQAARRACGGGRAGFWHLFDCPLCGGNAYAMRLIDGYAAQCESCEKGFRE